MAVGSYEVGVIQRTPVPNLSGPAIPLLRESALRCVERKRFLDTAREVTQVFGRPELLQVMGDSLFARCSERNSIVNGVQVELEERQREIDVIVYQLYGIAEADQAAMDDSLGRGGDSNPDGDDADGDGETPDTSGLAGTTPADLVASLLSYAVGCAFGRWDVRIGKGEKEPPPLPGPFDPLPPCSPGMLVGPDGLPAREAPPGYPVTIQWDGILVDDPGHPADIVARVREVLVYLFSDGDPAAVEEDACRIIGVRDLREWFRQEFFPLHIKMYSKSRRKAPIYWPLSTASGSYTIWLYYHRLNDQTLYMVVNKYMEPKISEVERGIAQIENELKAASGREATRLTDRLNEARAFLGELRDLREELLRIAALPYKPDLNDGVIINAAPLHRLFRLRSWAKDTEDCWKKLEKGDYDWAHLAYTIWPERVREV